MIIQSTFNSSNQKCNMFYTYQNLVLLMVRTLVFVAESEAEISLGLLFRQHILRSSFRNLDPTMIVQYTIDTVV